MAESERELTPREAEILNRAALYGKKQMPDDILEAAREIARLAGRNYIGMGPMGFIGPIADALLAERERCARVASKLSQLDKPHLISVAIREPWKFEKMVEFYEDSAIRQDNPDDARKEQGNG